MKATSEINMPRLDVVSQAITTIVEGVCKENDLDIQYSGVESTDGLPVHRLPATWDALKAAKVRMDQQMDQLIARLTHRWNLASSIHRLPAEVLAIIFQDFEPSPPHPDGHSSLLDLLLVCRAWYDVITGTPQLWRSFGAHTPYNIARRVVDRSKALPISVDWRPSREPPKRDLGKVLDLAIENSTRIKSLAAGVPCKGDLHLWKLLQAPTPVLETLQVYAPDTSPDVIHEFVLSEGQHLKHLSLLNVTPFDSPRLSNLISLTLLSSSWPRSFEDFVGILSSSPRLETLTIEEVSHKTGEVRAHVPLPVVLPHLTVLVLSKIPSVYVAATLASIYTPSCTYVEVIDWTTSGEEEAIEALDAVIWRPGNDQAAVLVGGTGPNIVPGSLSIEIEYKWIKIKIGSRGSSQGHRRLDFARMNVPRMVERLSTTFSQLPSPPAVHLHRRDTDIEGQSPVDLLPWSDLLDSLLMEGSHACRSVLQELSRRHVLPGTGTGGGDWICGRLSSIKLLYAGYDEEDAALDGGALLSLVRQRWSGDDGCPGAARPAVFEVVCNKANFPNLWSLEGEIMQMLPSFKLNPIIRNGGGQLYTDTFV